MAPETERSENRPYKVAEVKGSYNITKEEVAKILKGSPISYTLTPAEHESLAKDIFLKNFVN